MSASEINSKAAEAIAAMEAGDDATALLKLNTVKILLISTPDVTHGEERLEWNRESIDSLITQARSRQAAAVGVQRSNVTYQGVDG